MDENGGQVEGVVADVAVGSEGLGDGAGRDVPKVDEGGVGDGNVNVGAEAGNVAEGETEDVDAELEAMKLRLQEMERASMGMKDGGAESGSASTGVAAASGEGTEGNGGSGGSSAPSATLGSQVAVDPEEAIADADSRSIYVGNVDYSATVEELGAYFADCGTINRVTIMCNKHTGQPKGFAYIEFEDQVAVKNAMILNDSQFRSRQLKVVAKRTNVPGVSRGGYRGRPRFSRGMRGGGGYSRRGRRGLRGRWSPY